MKYLQLRQMILEAKTAHDALNLLIDSDRELRNHLESLVISEWEKGYDTGYQQAQSDINNKNEWDKHESHV